MSNFIPHYKWLLTDPERFAKKASGITLRKYQCGVLAAIFDSVLNQRGLTFVVIFPRQSGKNELQAQLETYLLTLFSRYPVEMVKVSPTLKPQALNAMRRLERTVKKNTLTQCIWVKESGSIYRVGEARITFLSAAPESSIVGATASALLEVDEAQDVLSLKYEKDVAPMGASTNATRVFWGTSWTSQTLLAQQMRRSQEEEKHDGIRRVFRLTADDVAAEMAAYQKHVEEAIQHLGRDHPTVRTQYFSEEIDGEGGLFPQRRLERMRSGEPAAGGPQEGRLYALLLDVAGEDEGVRSIEGALTPANPARDSNALTIVEVRLSDETHRLPVYTPVWRAQWTGVNHAQLHNEVRDIALSWNARAVVVDATGVGAGLASFLDRSLPGRVTPFTFNTASKSSLGWDFLGIIDSGRWREPLFDPEGDSQQARMQQEFFTQLRACQFQVDDGPERRIKWGVPETARSTESGEILHDDWILSAALSAVLEKLDWHTAAPALIIPAPDPLQGMEGKF